MPPVIIAVVAYVAGYITAQALIIAIVAYGLTQFQASRMRRKARDNYNKSLQDRLVMTATVDQARTRCYGRVRNVDGVVFKATWGAKKQFYTLVISLAGHEIDGVEKVMFGDVELTLDGLGQVLTAPWQVSVANAFTMNVPIGVTSVALPDIPISGSVWAMAETSDGDEQLSVTVAGGVVNFPPGSEVNPRRVVYQVAEAKSRAVVTVFNGGSGQDLSGILATRFPGMIVPGAHRFAGMACLLVELAYDQDAYPNGVPNPITAVFRGAKVLDPRTGVTAWSENPALIARDWALYANGGGCSTADLVGEDFIAAANACDVSHAFTSVNGNGASTTTTRPMYTCGIVCDTSANPMETLAAICESMAGDFAWPGGLLSVRAGAYTAPAWTIDGDWLSDKGEIQMVKDAPRSELINVLIPTIANAANRYIAAPLPRVVADAYVTVDGEEYPQELQFEGITDSDHAGHVASVMLKDARAAKTYTLPCNLRGLQVKIGQNATVNIPEIGLSNELMRCVGWKLDFEQSCCYLTMKSTSAAIFDPDATFKRDDALPNSSLPNPFIVPNVAGLTIASGTEHLFVQSDGTVISRVLVSWTQAADEAVQNGGAVEIRYGTFDMAPGDWHVVSVPGVDTQVYLTGLEDQRFYVFMARFRNKLVSGGWGPLMGHQVLGKSVPPVAPVGLSAVRSLGALKITRTPSTEADWAYSIFEYSTDGGTTFHPITGTSDKNGILWPGPVLGALKIRARDVDSSDNLGAWSAPLSVTVTEDEIGSANYGSVLNDSPWFDDDTAWVTLAGTGALQFLTGVANAPGGTAIVNAGGRAASPVLRRPVPITRSRTYKIGVLARQDAGTGGMYLGVEWLDKDGAHIDAAAAAPAGWTNTGYSYFGLIDEAPPGLLSFTRYSITFGAGAAAAMPANACFVRLLALLNYPDFAGTQQRITDFFIADVTEANSAQADANAALSALTLIASDSWLTRGEKPAVVQQWVTISSERAGIVARANGYAIVTERDAYTAAHDALNAYLSALSPPYNDVGSDTAIVAATFSAKFTDLYAARQALLNKIAAAAGTVSVGFRQGTDPNTGGITILDGTEWLDTSTGKSWKWYSGAWRPNVGAGSVGTGELANQAATEVYQDNFDIGGPTIPATSTWTDLRSFTVTPPVNSTINLTALLDCSINFDAGTSRLRWAYSVGGGADVDIAPVAPLTFTASTFVGRTGCQLSLAASAGVSYVFKVQGYRDNATDPSARARFSQMRAEVVKR